MKRRNLLKGSAATGLLALGSTVTGSASSGSESAHRYDDPKITLLEDGERVVTWASESDVRLEDCCVSEDGCTCDCYCCIC